MIGARGDAHRWRPPARRWRAATSPSAAELPGRPRKLTVATRRSGALLPHTRAKVLGVVDAEDSGARLATDQSVFYMASPNGLKAFPYDAPDQALNVIDGSEIRAVDPSREDYVFYVRRESGEDYLARWQKRGASLRNK